MTNPGDERTIGEVARLLDSLVRQVESMNTKIDDLGTKYVPRESYDIAFTSLRNDIIRVENTQAEALAERRKTDQAVIDLDEKLDDRFRKMVTGIASAVIAPIVVAVIVYILMNGLQK